MSEGTNAKWRRWIKVGCAILVLLPCLSMIHELFAYHGEAPPNWSQVHKGMTKAELFRLVGRPDSNQPYTKEMRSHLGFKEAQRWSRFPEKGFAACWWAQTGRLIEDIPKMPFVAVLDDRERVVDFGSADPSALP